MKPEVLNGPGMFNVFPLAGFMGLKIFPIQIGFPFCLPEALSFALNFLLGYQLASG